MSKRTNYVTMEFLETAPLPDQTVSYTVIPHKRVNDKVEAELLSKGFDIEKTIFRANAGAQIASGTVLLKQGDNEMRMMFTWANSYDKSMKFKCAIGGYLPQSESIMISGNMGSWGRKHTGSADTEMEKTIQDQLLMADTYYKSLVEDKEIMKEITIESDTRASALGILFFEHGVLTGEQMGIIKQEIRKPSFVYNGPTNSLWHMYCHIIFALQKSHPKKWLDQQRLVHFMLCDMFGVDTAKQSLEATKNAAMPMEAMAVVSEGTFEGDILQPKDPAQLDLVDEITKAEGQKQEYDITKEE